MADVSFTKDRGSFFDIGLFRCRIFSRKERNIGAGVVRAGPTSSVAEGPFLSEIGREMA